MLKRALTSKWEFNSCCCRYCFYCCCTDYRVTETKDETLKTTYRSLTALNAVIQFVLYLVFKDWAVPITAAQMAIFAIITFGLLVRIKMFENGQNVVADNQDVETNDTSTTREFTVMGSIMLVISGSGLVYMFELSRPDRLRDVMMLTLTVGLPWLYIWFNPKLRHFLNGQLKSKWNSLKNSIRCCKNSNAIAPLSLESNAREDAWPAVKGILNFPPLVTSRNLHKWRQQPLFCNGPRLKHSPYQTLEIRQVELRKSENV